MYRVNTNMKLFILIFIIYSRILGRFTLSLNDACQSPSGVGGTCVSVRSCQHIVDLLKGVISTNVFQYLQNSRCGEYGGKPIVCCPYSGFPQSSQQSFPITRSSALPQPPECGLQLSDRIVGGEITGIDDHPWLVLIQYSKGGSETGFHCGGSLINNRYVLTAAHCLLGLPKPWRAVKIRLGEWDTGSTTDCDSQRGICSDPVQDIPIESYTVHENYDPNAKTQFNDIALIRMSMPIKYTDFIQPICLPLSQKLKSQNFDGKKLFVAGWGQNEYKIKSRYKNIVDVDGFPITKCNSIFKGAGIPISTSQICAGGVAGKDSCKGDSGGPLMKADNPYWHIVGIVSFGATDCGSDGIPGIYTKVSNYIEWITTNIKP